MRCVGLLAHGATPVEASATSQCNRGTDKGGAVNDTRCLGVPATVPALLQVIAAAASNLHAGALYISPLPLSRHKFEAAEVGEGSKSSPFRQNPYLLGRTGEQYSLHT